MLNSKQEELVERLINVIREKFPDTELICVTESPENPETLWIKITMSEDEDKKIEIREFGNDKATDILIDYGYHMLVMLGKKDKF